MENKEAAKKFRECWLLSTDSEVGGYQKYWISLLGDVLGEKDVLSRISFQLPVPMAGTTKFLDAWIPETKVLIEHKKRGVKLDASQSGHNGMTPYEQAVEYDNARPFDEKARWIVTCNFDEIWIYDRTRPLDPPETVALGDLPNEVHRLAFLVNRKVSKVDSKELEISVQAGRIVAKLYDALLKQYESDSPETLASLNRLCVRLVFCLYAEDADIFPKNAFRNLVKATPVEFLRRQLLRLFQTLDTPPEKRDRYLEAELAVFPYTNGGLFAGASESEIPPVTEEIARLLDGSSGFDLSGISPTIFGALFESTLNPQTRRAGGMVYTSVENIHKVIDPLFMDGLRTRVDEFLGTTEYTEYTEKRPSVCSVSSVVKKKLLALQDEIASLTFLDPACGSGNFLTETYLSLRRLENRIIAALQGGQGEFDLGEGIGAKVSIQQFKGIEINDFAVSVAKTAMWIAEAQMLRETAEILHREPDFLPLKEYDGIVQGNALRLDWGKLLNVANEQMLPITNTNSQLGSSKKLLTGNTETGNTSTLATFSYIMGNPPFVGYSLQSKEQKADILDIYRDEKGKPYKTAGKVDYVAGWYWKAAELALAAKDAKNTKIAFVSTNSICQGEQVAAVWKPLVERFGLEIDFAYRTFRWDSEAHEKAHVHCVIVGFHVSETTEYTEYTEKKSSVSSVSSVVKKIFDGDKVIAAEHINGYLMDGPDVWVESRTKPVCDVPVMTAGNRPADGGHLIIEAEEYDDFIKNEPASIPYIKKLIGSEEFIKNKKRYCLWLKDASPAILRSMPLVMKRIEACRNDRLNSPDAGRRKLADTPALFRETMNPDTFIVVPSVSSERRQYVPIGFLDKETIPSNLVLIIPSATLYHFGVLTSSVHMAWMRVVAGRLETRYRYSAAIVYNNFPWPEGLLLLRGDSEIRSLGEGSEKTPNLQNSKTPSSESNINHSVYSVSSVVKNISLTAQAILDARALYPDSSLADLYDPLTMPPELRKAHAANDRAVLAAYGLPPDTPEPEIVSHLMKLYQSLTAKEG